MGNGMSSSSVGNQDNFNPTIDSYSKKRSGKFNTHRVSIKSQSKNLEYIQKIITDLDNPNKRLSLSKNGSLIRKSRNWFQKKFHTDAKSVKSLMAFTGFLKTISRTLHTSDINTQMTLRNLVQQLENTSHVKSILSKNKSLQTTIRSYYQIDYKQLRVFGGYELGTKKPINLSSQLQLLQAAFKEQLEIDLEKKDQEDNSSLEKMWIELFFSPVFNTFVDEQKEKISNLNYEEKIKALSSIVQDCFELLKKNTPSIKKNAILTGQEILPILQILQMKLDLPFVDANQQHFTEGQELFLELNLNAAMMYTLDYLQKRTT